MRNATFCCDKYLKYYRALAMKLELVMKSFCRPIILRYLFIKETDDFLNYIEIIYYILSSGDL